MSLHCVLVAHLSFMPIFSAKTIWQTFALQKLCKSDKILLKKCNCIWENVQRNAYLRIISAYVSLEASLCTKNRLWDTQVFAKYAICPVCGIAAVAHLHVARMCKFVMMCTVAVYAEWISVCIRHWCTVTGTVSFDWYHGGGRQNASSQYRSHGWQHGSLGQGSY